MRDSLVTSHSLLGLQQRRPDPIAVRVSLDLGSAPVEEDLAAFLLTRRDELFDFGLCLRRDDGTAAPGTYVSV
jgi:hypothetical protein